MLWSAVPGGSNHRSRFRFSRFERPRTPPPEQAGEKESAPLALDLMVGTRVPIFLGGGAQLELPERILVSAHLGWLPPPYVDLINDVSTGLGLNGDLEAQLIRAALESSFLVDLGVGWCPFADYGFEFKVGYIFTPELTLMAGYRL